MKKRVLGRTGLEVSELSLGGLFVSQHGQKSFEEASGAIHRALELGVNYIDTAPGYFDSEEVLGKALVDVTAPYVLSTKLGGRPDPFDPKDKDALRRSVIESLRLLGRDHIDILMIHEPERPGQHDWWNDWESVVGPVTEVLADLKSEGIIKHTGLGGTTVYEMIRIIQTGQYDVVLTAFNYSLLWREAQRYVVPAAKKQNMGIVIGSPLQQGALARRYDLDTAPWMSIPRREQYQQLYAFLDEIAIPLPELGIRLVLSDPDVHTTLMGARSVEEVEQNAAAAEAGPLPDDIVARLDEIAAMVPFRPCEEPAGLPFGWQYKGPGSL
ncbi:MAG: aldo/keto reductase [Planctomycetes bacterium]|nr:aldo/keto reductase [Planctomycetota bacterium]